MFTSKDSHFDVTIIGAGPSGAVLAYELARQGVRVLVLDKAKLPRNKVCAGGVTVRACSVIPFDFSEIVENVIYGARLSRNLIPQIVRRYDKPLVYTVMRDKFDYWLISKACESGATLNDGVEVKYIEFNKDQVSIKTSNGTLSSPVLVGADGANSIVVQSLGRRKGFQYGVAINGHITVNQEKLLEWDGLIGLDYGVGDGFTWVFPKQNCLSIGAGGSFSMAKKLKPYVLRLVNSYDLGAIDKAPMLRGHLLPVRKPGTPICFQRGLLVGDAAGLLDPLSGEGIYYGVKSAHLASNAILGFFSGKNDSFKDYEKAVDAEIMPEIRAARVVQKMNSLAPSIFFNLLRDNDRAWRAFCQILRGERTYASLKNSLSPPLKLLFRLF